MSVLSPLPVALPLLTAVVILALHKVLARRVEDVLSLITSMAVAIVCALLMRQSSGGLLVYWFGGWTPRHGVAVGIAFTIDPLGAGLATLTALLITASFVFTWHYFDAVDGFLPCADADVPRRHGRILVLTG